MGVLTVQEITNLALDRIQANVTVDAPFLPDEVLRHINDAYRDVWELSGGAMKRVPGGTLWTPQPATAADGIFTATLADIGEVRELFHSVTPGSIGDAAAGDVPLEPVDHSYLTFLRANQALFGSYLMPKVYSLTRNFSTTPADVNKMRLDVWPARIGAYFPTHYIPQFTLLDYTTVTVPAVNDLESSDIALLAASRMAPLIGRAEFVPSILADVSQRTQQGLARKESAMADARADR